MKIVFLLLFNFIFSSILFAQTNINYYEYWFDSDYAGKIIQNINPVSSYELIGNIPTSSLKSGLHTFHIRFKDDSSKYSSVNSQTFIKLRFLSLEKIGSYF